MNNLKPGDLIIKKAFAYWPTKLTDGSTVWFKSYNLLKRAVLKNHTYGSPKRGGIKNYVMLVNVELLKTPLSVDPVRTWLELEANRISKLNDNDEYTLEQFLYGKVLEPTVHDLRN